MEERRGAYNLRERDHLEKRAVYGRILNESSKIWGKGIDWVDLAQDRNTWWAPDNAIMNLRFP